MAHCDMLMYRCGMTHTATNQHQLKGTAKDFKNANDKGKDASLVQTQHFGKRNN